LTPRRRTLAVFKQLTGNVLDELFKFRSFCNIKTAEKYGAVFQQVSFNPIAITPTPLGETDALY